MNEDQIKNQVKDYWDNQACGSWVSDKSKFTKEYFEEIEEDRYIIQPEIFSFAEFTRYHGKKLLEVGVGAGTDFLQWVRAGTQAHGIDLTPEAIDHVKHRLDLYGLQATEFKVADCENLPYEDGYFDIVYSWGVIHHTPDTEKSLREIIRVTKPGGKIKVMIYHRHSLLAYFFWVKHALLKLQPWKSISRILYDHMESIGTKAYTRKEVMQWLSSEPVTNIKIKPVLSYYDKLERFNPIMRFISKVFATILGRDRVGWFLTIECEKK